MKINGKLSFDASSASTIENLRVEKVAALPQFTAADVGRLVYLTTGETGANVIYYGDDNSWEPLATGGSAFSQAEGDAMQTTLGAAMTSTGTLNAAAFSGPIASATSFTDAINQLAAYADANNTLGELDDVTLATPTTGQYLRYNATTSKWENDTLTVSDVTDLTATAAELNTLDGYTGGVADLNKLAAVTADAAELNILDGATLSTQELNFVDGVTSSIQTQLNDKQALDATLTALAGLNSDAGIVVQTGADAFAKRELVAPAAGITISNPAGTGGNPTFALANDLAALEGLATTGLVVRTGDGTATTTTITGTAGNISVADGSGAAGNPTLDLVDVTDAGTGTFLKFTRDAKGRVSGTTAVVTSDITALVDTTYVNVAGDTMTGNLVMGSNFVTMNGVPTEDTHAANKAYVDAVTAGLSWKQAVKVASTAPLTLATGFAAGQIIDGVTLVIGDRILVKDQAATAENGIYVVTSGAPTRAADMNVAAEFDGSAVFVQQGTVNEGTGWTETATVATVDTSPVLFSQFSGGQAFIWGDGLGNSGNTIFVKMGAGVAMLPSDEVGLDVEAAKAVQLTSTDAGGKLTFVLDGAGLEQSALGLKISANGITNAMILNDAHPAQADSGSGSLDLGDTLHIVGVSTQGTSVSVNETVPGTVQFIVTAADASASQKGVASFASDDFAVTNGAVTIKTAGVDNAQLANSSITVTGTNGSDAVALGESFAIIGGSSPITTVSADNSVTINVADATTTTKGLASFDTAHFSVTAGAVSLAATLDDLTNVSSADAAITGHVLVKSEGDWAPVSPATLAGTMLLGDLQDVGSAAPSIAGHALIADGTAWQAKKMYHLHSETAAATTWTVTHNIGQKYCNVTIVDSDDGVIIPQSIVFNSTSQLTVTFNTAITGKVVVMGIA